MDDKEKSIIKQIQEIQGSMPNIVLPTMGIIQNETKLIINNEAFINKNASKENKYVKVK